MTLGTIVDNLKYGNLRSLALKEDNFSIVSYVNLALIALYERFQLKTSEQIIPLFDNIVDYTLNDDCMTILAVYDENGDEFVINEPNNRFAVFQPSYDTLQVANPNTGSTLGIVYITAPTTIIYVDIGSLTTTIPLPPQLTEPLLHYISYLAHSSVNSVAEEMSNPYYARYEASCNRIEKMGSIRKDVVAAHVSLKEGISELDTTYQITDLNT